ncbi:MAG: methyltransferase, UbiE/COQ5 family [Candidatus Ozemobacter sibiricus]|jgi:SAM-dependent methyltransferase|uniref:Methyltransferase, UbiE/COQ5 family n=1 Tax=Candidatus Ozemobacter sibiricus TaxID=2268124 RepID=A0A367ZWW5_9BACT|nr:MAG: methyltransferase, UbiE/COQ5 family [Candidatus Ozemobacter sibiricus]
MASAEPGRQPDFADSYIRQSEQALAPIFAFLTRSVLSRLPAPPTGGTAIDLGGGTGQWLEALLEAGLGCGILVDEDAEMTRHAFHARARLRGDAAFLVIRAQAEALPLRNAIGDLVVSRNSMHLWHDLPRAWQEIGRILRPGGWVFIGRGFGPDLPTPLRDQVRQARRALRDPHEPPVEEPPSPSPATVAELAARAGIVEVAVIPDHKSSWFLGQRRS